MAAKEQTENNEKPPGQRPSTAQKSGTTARWIYIMRQGAETNTHKKETNRDEARSRIPGYIRIDPTVQRKGKKSEDEKPRKRGQKQVLSDKIR